MVEDPDYANALKSAALRVTRPRIAVLHAVARHLRADTEVVIDSARQQVSDISGQTVFDPSSALAAAGRTVSSRTSTAPSAGHRA